MNNKRKSPPPFSEEHKRKIGINGFHYGMKGKHHSEESKNKMRLIFRGIKKPQRTKQHSINISIAKKGCVPWNKGKKTGFLSKNPEETRNKLSKTHKGAMSYLWKGGITEINKALRNGLEYRLWRESVFKRDNWTCVWCFRRGIKMEADHIKPFSLFPELRFAIDNGRTLCVECHRKTDTYGSNSIRKT